MNEVRETAQKEQQELKIEQEKIREQKAKLEAEEEQRLQAVGKDPKLNITS